MRRPICIWLGPGRRWVIGKRPSPQPSKPPISHPRYRRNSACRSMRGSDGKVMKREEGGRNLVYWSRTSRSPLEYRLEAIGAEITAGEMAAAQASLADLRRLPQAYRDPFSSEPAAARLAGARNDAKSEAEHGEEALHQARSEAPGLITEAQLELAKAQLHLGDFERSKNELDAAIAGYRAMGNPRGRLRRARRDPRLSAAASTGARRISRAPALAEHRRHGRCGGDLPGHLRDALGAG